MVWNSTWPNTSKSVKFNGSTGTQNTTYIENTMGVDHFWNIAGSEGHHRQVQMPMTGTAASPTNITLAAGMDGGIFFKAKSTAESVTNQDVQPFFIDNTAVAVPGATQLMQMLGIRAMALFTDISGTIVAKYLHNITAANIVRTAGGKFTITFTNALPSAFYLVLGGCLNYGSADQLGEFSVQSDTGNPPTTKTTTLVKIQTRATGGTPSLIDPNQVWLICFGG